MRVVLVGPYPLDPERVAGGVEAAFSTLLFALGALPDLELQAITFVPGLGYPIRRIVNGVLVRYLPAPRRFRSLRLHARERRSLAAALADLRPDVVHAQDALQYGYVCLKTAGRTPVVVSIHGIARASSRLAPSTVVRLRHAIALTTLERYCIRHARYLMQPTRYPEDYFRGEIRGRVWDISNPIPDEFFAIEPAPEPGRVLYAGSVIPRKRLLDLVEAMPTVCASVPDARLHVAVGEPDPGYAARVRTRAEELGVQGRIAFLGARSPRQMVEEYRRASVLVLPSGQETSPMVIGEAMAAGVPVVATRVGGVPYLVEEGVTGHLVEVGDVPALAEGVAGLLADPARAAAYGAAGRAKAEERFRLRVVSEQVRAMYEEAIRAG